jgi:hypothetical protein
MLGAGDKMRAANLMRNLMCFDPASSPSAYVEFTGLSAAFCREECGVGAPVGTDWRIGCAFSNRLEFPKVPVEIVVHLSQSFSYVNGILDARPLAISQVRKIHAWKSKAKEA